MNPSPVFIVFTAGMIGIAACFVMLIVRSLLGKGRESEDGKSVAVPESGATIRVWLFVALLFGSLIGCYYVLRYRGLWMETDTATITFAIEAMRKFEVLMPKLFHYQHGFGYQANSIALLHATGLTTQTLQTIFYPVLATVGLVLTSFIFFREVLKDPRAAILASMLLLLQPEILFVTLRGSHEKMIWPLMMLALTLLYRSFGQPLRKMVIYVVLFYVVVFAIDSTNIFFGSVFLVAVILSMLLGYVPFRLRQKNRPPLPRRDVQRLMYISLSGGILIYFIIVYIYPPALANLRTLRNIVEQLSALLLSFEVKAQPYGYISTGWINSGVYLMLTMFTWIVLGISLLEWLRHGWKMVQGKMEQGLTENLDWLLYTGFAIQIAVSIVVDLSGALSANMQLRLFPSFTVVAIVLLVRFLKRFLSTIRWRAMQRRVILALTAGLSGWFCLACVFKSTNEPLLSNKWSFYVPADKASVYWAETHLRDAEIWTIVDERLAMLFSSFFRVDSVSENHYRFGILRSATRYVLATELDRLRAQRLGIALPPIAYWDQIYDSGQVQIDRIPLVILEEP